MAVRLSEVFVEIGARTAKFNKGIDQASLKLSDFGKRVTNFSKDNALALAAFSAAGALAFKNLVDVAGEFDASMRRVRAVSGATEDQFGRLTEVAKKLGRTTQFSASQAAEGMEFLAKAGFEADEVIGAIPGTLELAAAASLDLGSAADIVSNVLTGFNLEVGQLARVNDVLAKAFTSSNTDLVQLGQAMKFAGPTAAGFGQDLEDVVAVLGAFGNAGIQASMAGTSLRGAMTRLANPSKEAEKILKELGITVFDSSGRMRNFLDIMEDLSKSGISAAQVMEVFGQRAGPAIQALLSQGIKGVRDFSAVLKDSAGTAAAIAKVQMEGFTGATKELVSAFEGLKIAIAGSGLLEFVASAVRALAGFTRALSSLPPEILVLTTAISGMLVVGASLLAFLGLATIAFFKAKAAMLAFGIGTTVATGAITSFTLTLPGTTVATTALATSAGVLTGALGLLAGIIAGLTVAFFKYRSAMSAANAAQLSFSDSVKTVAQRQKEGFAISNKFRNMTVAQVKAMKNGAIVAEELSRGIRGLSVALERTSKGDQGVAGRTAIQARINRLKLLREAALASEQAQIDAQAEKTAQATALAEFEAKRKQEIAQDALTKALELMLIEKVNAATTAQEKMLAEANLAAFRKEKGLEVFDFQKSLLLRTGALLKSEFGSLVTTLAKGQETFADASKKVVRTMTDFVLKSLAEQLAAETAAAIKRIAMARSVASANAVQAEAGKGLLGIGTATIAVAAFSALISRFANFNKGGEVPGLGNTDKVPALLTPGERVLTKSQNRALKSGGGTVVNIFNPIVDSDERLEELADRVGSRFMDRLLLEGRTGA